MNRPKRHYRGFTPEQAREIRRRYLRREATQAALAREFGIKQNTVSRIVSGLTWSHA